MNRNRKVAAYPTERLGNTSKAGDDNVLSTFLFLVCRVPFCITGRCGEATCLCYLAFSLTSSLMGLFSARWLRVLMRPRLCLVGGRKQVSLHVLPVHFYFRLFAPEWTPRGPRCWRVLWMPLKWPKAKHILNSLPHESKIISSSTSCSVTTL